MNTLKCARAHCNIAKYEYMKYSDTWNVHMHRNPETLSLFRYETFDFLSLVFRHKERETHNFYYADRSIWPNNRAVHPVTPTGLASSSFKSQLASPSFGSQLTAFFQNHQNPSPSLPGMTSFAPQSHFLSGFFIMTFVIVTSSALECEHLHSMCAPARALSRIVLSLTKLNDKI